MITRRLGMLSSGTVTAIVAALATAAAAGAAAAPTMPTAATAPTGMTAVTAPTAATPPRAVDRAAGAALAPIAPTRVLDTRNGTGAREARVAAGGTLRVDVTGVGGVPATGVSAVILNVAAVGPTSSGWVTVHPSGSPRPHASNLNYGAGRTVANQVVAMVGADGQVAVHTSSATDLVADVVGYYPAGAAYRALNPARLVDSRSGRGTSRGPRDAGAVTTVQVTGRGGVPRTGVGSVILNVTAVQPRSNGYLTAYPSGSPLPATSDVNVAAGQLTAGMTIVPVGSLGRVAVRTSAPGHLVVDVLGWMPTASDFHPVTRARLVDTRSGKGAPRAKVPAGGSVTVQVGGRASIPTTGVRAVALNLTSVNAADDGYLTSHVAGTTRPTASVLNYAARQARSNSVTARLSADGRLTIHSSAASDVVVDVAGWYGATVSVPAGTAPGTVTTPATTTRILQLTNQARASARSCGTTRMAAVPPLRLDSRLNRAAQKHSEDQAATKKMTHTTPTGAVHYRPGMAPWDRMTAEGYRWTSASENVAAGYRTPEAVMEAWLASPGHCKNVMSATSRDLGVGHKDGYWAQKFGRS